MEHNKSETLAKIQAEGGRVIPGGEISPVTR